MKRKSNDRTGTRRTGGKSKQSETRGRGWSLLANGSSGGWDIAVDEERDGDEWSFQINGPHAYPAFQLEALKLVDAALRFLESGLGSNQISDRHKNAAKEFALTLGRFGSAPVSLRWDNEDFARVFLVIGPKGGSTLLWSLEGEDIPAFIEALRQVVEDISDRHS